MCCKRNKPFIIDECAKTLFSQEKWNNWWKSKWANLLRFRKRTIRELIAIGIFINNLCEAVTVQLFHIFHYRNNVYIFMYLDLFGDQREYVQYILLDYACFYILKKSTNWFTPLKTTHWERKKKQLKRQNKTRQEKQNKITPIATTSITTTSKPLTCQKKRILQQKILQEGI